MNSGILSALTTGLQTGLSPAQQIDIRNYQEERPRFDDTPIFIGIIAAAFAVGLTIYLITRK